MGGRCVAEEIEHPADEAPEEEAHTGEEVADVTNEPTTTVWSPEPTGADEVLNQSVDDWIADVEFESTADVPIPERLVDQVIGQEAGSVVIKKAAEQRRHMLMIGDPGTGKSMLARSMTDLLPKDALEDVLVYPNEDDENVPRVRTVPAGRAERIVKVQKEAVRQQREKSQRMLFIAFAAIGFLLLIAALQSGDLFTLLFGGFLLVFGYMFIRSRLGAVDDSRIPKVLVKHDLNELPPSLTQQPRFPAPCSATCATTRSNPVGWKHPPTTELNRAPSIALTRGSSTLTRSTCCASRNNKRF